MSAAGKRVVILVEDGFEDGELIGPLDGLRDAGVTVTIVGPAARRDYAGKHGQVVTSDTAAGAVRASDVDAVIIPGGYAPDRMRMRHAMVDLTRAAFDAGKPVAAICHGPQLLIEADVVRGRKLTSYPSVKTDLINAGANWVDQEVVVDNGLVTSRKPDDIPAFNAKMIEEFAEGRHDAGAKVGGTRERKSGK